MLSETKFNQNLEFSSTDQIDLYDGVLMATSQPSDDRSSSMESPPPICQKPSPKTEVEWYQGLGEGRERRVSMKMLFSGLPPTKNERGSGACKFSSSEQDTSHCARN
uniref:Uncharacterized protein n=1 Tax=Suricata suricatta TaxID=37032 RepID=A0A673V3U9_SURSU